ncbi:MAG: PH domain-containing protein [Oscillospiraceae bacterium]
MGLMGKLGSSVVQGVLGNMSDVSIEALQAEYGAYLMDGEQITTGFKLIRDAMIITDRRIIDFDKQGATGQKVCVNSIYLDSIFAVSAETAGFGIDDSEIELSYISTPYLKAHGTEYAVKKYEFPKKYNVQELYKTLQELAYVNYEKLNA